MGAAKDLKISYLLDFYGEMLTETQREAVDAFGRCKRPWRWYATAP